MSEIITKLSNRVNIKLSRALNFASYKMSELSLDIFYAFISELKYEDSELKLFKIRIVDLEEKIGRKIDRNYLQNIQSEFTTTVVALHKSSEKLTICNRFDFNSKEGWIEFEFNTEIKPHILSVEKNFVSADIRYLFMIKGAYSKRLYLLLKQNKNMSHKLEISLEELRNILSIDSNKYQLYADFKRRVIASSQNQFNITDLNFKVKEIKTGRRVTDLIFRIQSFSTKLQSNTKTFKNSLNSLQNWLQESEKKEEIIEAEIIKQASWKHLLYIEVSSYYPL